MQTSFQKQLHKGLSLVETLVVMVIIAFLMTLALQGLNKQKENQIASENEIRMKAIEVGLKNYYEEYQTYPEPEEFEDGAITLFRELYEYPIENDEKPYVAQFDPKGGSSYVGKNFQGKTVAVDAWGKPFIYRYPADDLSGEYDFGSLGPDGKFSEDDINNWEVE